MSQTPLFQKMTPYAFLLGILLAAAPRPAASNVKLSGLMPTFGSVSNFRIGSDGEYTFYRADPDNPSI